MSIEEHIVSLPPDSSDPIGRLAPLERDVLKAWGDVTHSVWWLCNMAKVSQEDAQRVIDFLVFLGLIEPMFGKGVYFRTRLGDETVQRIRRLERDLGYPFWAQAAAVVGGVILVAAVIAGIATWACAR